MAVTKLSNSGIKTGVLKYDSMLAGNAPFIPSAFDSIATLTASGGETTLTFSSIPQTYRYLILRGSARFTATGAGGQYSVGIRFNGDTGGSSYPWRWSKTAGATVNGQNFLTASRFYPESAVPNGNTTGMFGVLHMDIQDYTSSTKTKTVAMLSGTVGMGSTNAPNLTMATGYWIGTNALTSIEISEAFYGSAFAAGTTYSLYGVE